MQCHCNINANQCNAKAIAIMTIGQGKCDDANTIAMKLPRPLMQYHGQHQGQFNNSTIQ
jgi:hypothetical protein